MKKAFSFTLDEDLINEIKSELEHGASLSQRIEELIRGGRDNIGDMTMKEALLQVNAIYKRDTLDKNK